MPSDKAPSVKQTDDDCTERREDEGAAAFVPDEEQTANERKTKLTVEEKKATGTWENIEDSNATDSRKISWDKEEEEEEKREAELDEAEDAFVDTSTETIAPNESVPMTESRPRRPMEPLRNVTEPGAYHVAGADRSESGSSTLESEAPEDSVAPASSRTPSTRIVEAWEVQDNEDHNNNDIEAKAQERLTELLRDAPVAQVQDGAPAVVQEEKRHKRRLIFAIGSMVVIVVAIGIALGIILPSSVNSESGDTSPATGSESPTICTFCFDGTIPPNLETNRIDDSRTCLGFMEEQSLDDLNNNDPECYKIQALAWKFCECPTLSPKSGDSLCSECNKDEEVPVGLHYTSIDALLDDATASIDCTCANPSILAQTLNVSRAISGDAVDDLASPQFAALEWTVRDASDKLSSGGDALSNDELRTRYLAAVLYYSMGGDDWEDSYGFLSEEHVCKWNGKRYGDIQGLGCNEQDQISAIHLDANWLGGQIPDEMGYLTSLVEIYLSGNNLDQTIPETLSQLSSLQVLDAENNALNSTIPTSIFTLSRLREVRLSWNYLLSGPIPATVRDAAALEHLQLNGNSLTGNIPASLGRSTVLKSLGLGNNLLTGNIPDFSSDSPLEQLSLYNNMFGIVGSIPASIGRLTNLTLLYLAWNGFTGTIPGFISALTNLEELDLENNLIEGTIPTELGTLRLLRYLFLSHNQFEGNIPSELGNLRLLEALHLRNNRLTGSILELTGCQNLTYVSVDYNNLTGNIGPVIDSLPRGLEQFDIGRNLMEGTIPSTIASLSFLQWFDAQGNKLNGTIPSELESLSMLAVLALAYNSFTGTVPTSLASLPLVHLFVQGNDLTGSLGAEFCQNAFQSLVANTCSEPERLECTCCTHCCSPELLQCAL